MSLLTLGMLLLAALPAPAMDSPPPLTRIADIRSLTPEEAAAGRPVRIRGVVTYSRGSELTVQDDTAGIWVNANTARERGVWRGDDATLARLRPGDVVEIEGISDRGGFSPPVIPGGVRKLGTAPLPPARPMDRTRFFAGADDCRRLEVRGVVQGYRTGQRMCTLILDADPGRFLADIERTALADPAALVDGVVRLQGVAIARFNARGEFLMPHVLLNAAADLVVETPPRAPPFEAPAVPLDRIALFRPEPLGVHRLCVEGTVTYSRKRVVYLQGATSAIRVTLRAAQSFAPGDRIEAAGFLDPTRPIRGMAEAEARRIGAGATPVPAPVTPADILAANRAAALGGLVAQPGDFDGKLIAFEARLVDWQYVPRAGHRILLDTEAHRVVAMLDDDTPRSLDRLQRGSVMAVTGIAQLEFDESWARETFFEPAAVSILLRTPADLAVLRPPPWWTLRRVLAALALVALALAAAVGWVALLQRRVAVQAAQLAREMRARREAAVESDATLRERNRLAANLHDTLLQTLSGIGFQLDACEVLARRAGGAPLEQLDVARRMVDHAVDELRGSVWELRGLPLRGKSLPDALAALVAHTGTGHTAEVVLHAEGPLDRVPEFVSGNVLLIVQEAVGNALRHARPRRVEVAAAADEACTRIALSVRDDGTGFDPAAAKGPAEGHFGLAGMKERAERLGGSLRVESVPGQGAVVHAEVMLKPYDGALA